MRMSIALLLMVLAAPVAAQSAMDLAPGVYGSAYDPALSCTVNPHRLDVTGPRPHVELSWEQPAEDPEAGDTVHSRYDVLAADQGTITLRREGSGLRADDGGPVIWVMRLTQNPPGYCWGRTDKPSVHCERPQVRCDSTTPTS